jgi:hypothetical protein
MDTLCDRIESITEQYLQGKSSKLILIVICRLSFVVCHLSFVNNQ